MTDEVRAERMLSLADRIEKAENFYQHSWCGCLGFHAGEQAKEEGRFDDQKLYRGYMHYAMQTEEEIEALKYEEHRGAAMRMELGLGLTTEDDQRDDWGWSWITNPRWPNYLLEKVGPDEERKWALVGYESQPTRVEVARVLRFLVERYKGKVPSDTDLKYDVTGSYYG